MTIDEMRTQRIDALASEYRNKGYAVQLHPDRSQLPDFLAKFAPDLIAIGSKDSFVIVVTPVQDFDSDEMLHLAEAIESQDHWKFEVVFVNGPVAPDVPAEGELAADEQVTAFIANAEILLRQNQVEAAVLLAWSAVDALLRRRARSAAPELERESSARVLKQLYSLGLLQPELYEKLFDLLRFRNALAHGFVPGNDVPELKDILDDIRRLQVAA